MQLRIAWGGGGDRIWQGSIRVSEGQLSQIEPLGIEADEPGSIWLEHGTIEVRERSARAFNGIDVIVTADYEAHLIISLASDQDEVPKQVEITLKNLIAQSHNSTLDDAGNRLLVSRSANDKLRMHSDRETLIFAPGEIFQFDIEPYLIEAGGAAVKLQAQVTSSPGGQRVWSDDFEAGEGVATSIPVKIPDAEGVYDLSITAATTARFRLRLAKPLAERKIQFVVLDTKAAPEAPASTLARVVEINPVNPRWWERFSNIPLIPGMRKGPISNGEAATWEHPKLGPMIQLGPGGADANVSWEAYPLPISNPGQPHVLEVEYPTDVPQTMGLSVLEPNVAGAVMPIGLDSGVYVSDEEAESVPRMAKHRLIFWPRTSSPLLLITNRRPGARAVYGKITVLAAAQSQFQKLPGRKAEGGNPLPPAFTDNRRPERLWAAYLDRPLFAENFSAPEALDASSHRSLDDWNTFYQGGSRLITYLKHVGYGGLMMSVYCDGSTLYPSQIVQPTPRYDTGAFFATGQDPKRKDVLELLFRMFDREQLWLIPGLHFETPLPELEAIKRAGGAQAVGIEWIGSDGKPWTASNPPQQGLAPYYNLLHPKVQEAMLNVARELTARYASHESFGGLALQLSADSYAQLPGEEWGFDDQTIARFEAETKVQVPGDGPQRFAARHHFLTGQARTAWLQWRAEVVADFHHRLRLEVSSRREDARLYLAGGALLDNRHAQFRLRPTLPRRTKVEEALVELGVRTQAYQDDQGIVLLRPQSVKPPVGSAPLRTADLETDLGGELDKLFSNKRQAAALFYHEPQKTRLASFDAKSPFGAANTYTWLVAQMSPSGQRNRSRFVHTLATLDAQEMFDGGWLLPLGQEAALKDVLSVYRQLPRARFETISGESQPVTVRTLTEGRQTYAYVVNDSPWDVSVSLRVDLPAEARLEKLGEGRGAGPLVRTGTDAGWTVALKPYDLVAVRFNAPNVRLRNPEISISEEVRRGLQRRIDDFGARVAALGNPQPISALENGGFESPSASEPISGWSVRSTGAGGATLDAANKHSGSHSVKVSGTGQPVGITSAPINPPATGRLAVEVLFRTADRKKPVTMRIGVEGESREGKFERYGVVPNVGANTAEPGDWARYSFALESIPNDGLTGLRVRFDLLSAGEVWIDDVQLFDLAFNQAERVELVKMVGLASVKLEAGQISDCVRLLEGYWPRFLVANVPLTQTAVAQRPRSTSPAAAVSPTKKTGPALESAKKPAKFIDTLKEYVPRGLK